ncbi:MAG: hypothetical protein JWM19_4757 [Actinomycetia bacterium]|nr:hypothetical protein [Actinomycetes bacterium]
MGSEGSGSDRGGAGQSGDPIGDFQRWLMKAGARSVGRDVADRVRSTINGGRQTGGDVWDVATTEPPPDEAPECAWCPICRAARRYRDSGSTAPTAGLGSQLAGVGDTLSGLAQDAFSIFETALRPPQRPASRPSAPATGSGPGSGAPAGSAPAGSAPADTGPSDDSPVVGSPVLGRSAVHPQDQDGEAADEGGDREERGEAGDGPAGNGGDDEVERPAE